MFSRTRILIVSPEFQTRRYLRVNLESQGYRVEELETGHEALFNAAHMQPDLIILDRSLPDLDGIEVLTRLRQRIKAPIMMLLPDDSTQDKIAVAEAGADDYFVRPIAIEALIPRMEVAFQHMYPHAHESVFTHGDLHVDLSQRRVMVQGVLVKLTATEYALLRFMIRHAGRVLTHRQILKALWGDKGTEKPHYLRVYMAQLRQKVEPDPDNPRFLKTEMGVGYRLAVGVMVLLFTFYQQFAITLEPVIALAGETL